MDFILFKTLEDYSVIPTKMSENWGQQMSDTGGQQFIQMKIDQLYMTQNRHELFTEME